MTSWSLYYARLNRTDERGASADAESGQVRNESQRDIFYAPLFAENRFVLGNFSITPGIRLENIWQDVTEEVNLDKAATGTPLGRKEEYDVVPLFGVGVEYALPQRMTVYGNFSQAYRPMIFTEAVPTGGTTFVSDDLESGDSWQGELGVRGQPQPWLFWDASLFYLNFDNQIGTIAVPGGTSLENIGQTVHRGAEAAVEVELLGLARALRGDAAELEHQFSLYGNVMLLDAEIEESGNPALVGNTPQYAPGYIIRTGAIYRWQSRAKVAFLGTFVDDHFADDGNTANFSVPGYMVWDLALEFKLYRNYVSLVGGVNNLFDEDYYARIRGDGIDPAYGRNYYAGLSVAF